MSRHSTVLRAARPTFDEGLVFAGYLDEAAEGFFRFLLGRRAGRILAGAYAQPRNEYSFQNVVFAEREETIVGMASSFSAAQRRSFSDRPLERASGGRLLRMVVIATLLAPLLRVLETIDDGDHYLQAIAVDDGARGCGLGSTLIDAVEERAVAGGSIRLCLDVSAGNDGARSLYERRGMSVESQWPKRLVIPGFRLLRMTKTL